MAEWDCETQLTADERKILHRAVSKVVKSVLSRERDRTKRALLRQYIHEEAAYFAALEFGKQAGIRGTT